MGLFANKEEYLQKEENAKKYCENMLKKNQQENHVRKRNAIERNVGPYVIFASRLSAFEINNILSRKDRNEIYLAKEEKKRFDIIFGITVLVLVTILLLLIIL